MPSDHLPWFDDADARLIQRLHGDFPLAERPFAQVGRELGLSEDEVLERLASLLAHGVLTRFGPLFHIERGGGAFVLAAMAVPEARFDAVAEQVNAWPEVAHNYRRESVRALGARCHAAARGNASDTASSGNGSPSGCACAAAAPRRMPLNMWFVVAAETQAAADAVMRRIEADTGLAVWRFPKEREFKVELKLPILEERDDAA